MSEWIYTTAEKYFPGAKGDTRRVRYRPAQPGRPGCAGFEVDPKDSPGYFCPYSYHDPRQKERRKEFNKKRKQLLALVIERDGPYCRDCGTDQHPSVDHIISLDQGGTNDPDNLQLLCRNCNSQKGTRG